MNSALILSQIQIFKKSPINVFKVNKTSNKIELMF